MKESIIYLLIFLVVCAAFETDTIKFIKEFAKFPITGRMRVCSFITCWGKDDVSLLKEISLNFQCTFTLHSTHDNISDWHIRTHLQLFVLDLSCPIALSILTQAEELKMFRGDYFWLFLRTEDYNNSSQNEMRVFDVFDNLDISVESQIYIADQNVARFQIISLYKRDPPDYPIEEKIGEWDVVNGINFTADRSPAVRRLNMEGRLFVAVMVITHPDSLNHMDDLVDTHIDNLSKINYVFTNLVVEGLNGTVRYITSEKWGAPDSNGTFDGMIGYAQRGEAEIVVSPSIMTLQRMVVLEYIAMTAKTRIKFIFLSPPLSYKNNIYILPFAHDVWYAIIGLFAFSVFVLYITSGYENGYKLKLNRRKIWHKREKEEEWELHHDEVTKLPNSWGDIVLMNIGTLCQQDIVVEPKGVAGRVLIIHVKIALLFLYVSYSAAIVVLLQSSDTSITTLAGLLKTNMKLGVHDIAYNKYYWETASDPVRKGLYKKINPEKDYLTPEEGVSRVRTGLFAFYIERTPGYHMVRKLLDEDEKCRLQELQESFIPDLDPTVTIRKYLSYSKILRIMFKRLHERGHTNREILRSTAKKPVCRENSMTYVSVSFIDCRQAVILLACGVIVAITVLIVEIIHYYKYKKSNANLIPSFVRSELEFYN